MANELTIKLNADVMSALRNVAAVKSELGGFGPAAVKGGPGLTALRSGLDSVAGKLGTLAKWGTLALGTAVAAGAVYAGSQIVKLGAQAEQTRMSFQTMLGSASKGNAMLGMLNQFANVTPFSNNEVIAAGKTLLSFGVSAGNVKGILKTVGDVSSGTGKSFTELSSIFGKVFAKGKADSETLNQMSEAGIPIVKILGQMYNKTGAEVYKMAENGQLSAASIQQAFQKMTGEGGVFANMMEKQSQTLGGLWSTVTGQLELFASTIGESVTPLLKVGLQYIMGWVDELAAMAQDGRAVQYLSMIGMTGVGAIGNLIKWWNRLYEYTGAVLSTMSSLQQMQIEGIQAMIAGAFVGIVDIGLAAINKLISAANNIPGINIDIAKTPDWVEKTRMWAKLSADEAKNQFNNIATGKAFKDAGANVDRKNAEVDAGVNKASSFITDWQAKAQDELIRRKLDEKKYAAELNGPGDQIKADDAGKTGKIKSEKIQVDDLTRIGLYNFGSSPIKSIDVERNNLLRQIRDKLESKQETVLA